MKTGSAEMSQPFPIGRLLLLAPLAGVAGTIVFEVMALVIAPVLLGAPLLPARLVVALGGALTGLELPMFVGWIGHLAAGLLVFPLGYALFLRHGPLQSWITAGVSWGIILWLFAQGVFAPASGGPFMSGFTVFALVSMLVHVIYALTVAWALHMLIRRG